MTLKYSLDLDVNLPDSGRMTEIWKTCVQAPDYLVSNAGRVLREKAARGARPLHEVKPFIAKDGRPTVTIRIDGVTKTLRVCNMVLETFKGPRPAPGMECCHRDGVPSNNELGNLRWDTSAGNKADMVAHGTRRSGEKHHNARLTASDVADIRRRVAAGEVQRVVGLEYGIAQPHVSKIVTQKRWA